MNLQQTYIIVRKDKDNPDLFLPKDDEKFYTFDEIRDLDMPIHSYKSDPEDYDDDCYAITMKEFTRRGIAKQLMQIVESIY